MSRPPESRGKLSLCLLLLFLTGAPVAGQQVPFTVEDVFGVGSLQVVDLSADGEWAAVTRVILEGRLGVDSHRYGDPTYVSPASGRLLVVNTRTGRQMDALGREAVIADAAWNEAATELAVVTHDGRNFHLQILDRVAGTLRGVSLAPGLRIAGEQGLDVQWTGVGSVLIPLRPQGWAEGVRDEFRRLTQGPVTVYSGDDPFLAWEALRRRGNEVWVAEVDLADGSAREVVAAQTLGRGGFHRVDDRVVYEADTSEKTSYDVIFGATSEVRVAPLTGGESRVVLEIPETRRVRWSSTGSHYAFAEKGAIYVGSIDDARPRHLIGPGPDAEEDPEGEMEGPPRYGLEGISGDGSRIVASTDDGYWLVDAESGTPTLMFSRDADDETAPRVSVIGFGPSGDRVILQVSSRTEWERGVSRWSESSGLEPLIRDGRIYSGFTVAESGSRVVFNAARGNRPNDLWAADLDFADDLRILASNPQLDDRMFGETELIRYLDVDGDRLNGVVYYPPGYREGTAYPTVMVVYEEFFDDRFNSTINVLTNAGYVVMQPSVDLEVGFPGEAWVKGVTAAANALIERGIADPDRLGVHGTSYGGYATNLLVTQTDRFKAAINISGKVDMISFYTDSPRLGVRNIHAPENSQDRIGATLWEQPQKYIEHSAIMFADRIETPLLLMTGEQDHNVPARTTMEMYYALRRLGKTVTWVNYVNGGHGMPRTNAAEVRDYHQRILEWYETYLGADADSDRNVTSGSGS